MAAKAGSTVKIHYKGTFDDGVAFDDSKDREPLEFTVGAGRVIPGFERNVIGMEAGQKKKFTVPAVDGYGERRPELLLDVPRTRFPENMDLKPGMVLTFKKDNMNFQATVAKVEGDAVKLDMNHPLAGKNLNFEIEVVSVA